MSVSSNSYDQLRALVLAGAIPADRPLVEIQLADSLGVSRPTIREALRRLEGDGLLRNDGRGLRVARLGIDEARSALLMRSALDGLHAELAAERCQAGEVAPAELRRLAEIADAADRHTRNAALPQAMQANRAFHQAIDELAASPVSAHAIDRVWDRIIISAERSLGRPERIETVHQEHRAIIAAIIDGDPTTAGREARHHVLATLIETDARDGDQ